MSNLLDQLSLMLSDDSTDARLHASLLVASSRALGRGDLRISDMYAARAYEVLCRIRARSQEMAELLDERQSQSDNLTSEWAQV